MAALRSHALAAALAAALLALGACDGATEASGPDAPGAPAGAAAGAARVPRNDDPRLVELRRAIELGKLDLARTLHAQVGALAGAEEPLLRARLALLAGDGTAALRAVEEARRAAPGDPAVAACAGEVFASLGRFDAAAREIEAGIAAAGRTAELERATGVALILQPGGAKTGIAHLERARALDPKLPFLDRALSQAALLEGRRLLSEADARGALARARQARELDPAETDATLLEADCRQVLNDFDGALALYADLAEAGLDVAATRADVHQRAATYELFRQEREKAIEHYRAARALGMDDAGLGFGATVLAQEVEAATARGIEAYDAGDLAAARAEFERALALDPGDLAARNHLGVALFRAGEHAAAADAWRTVLDAARAAGIELPEPVELNLARAQKLAGRSADARATIEAFLADDPESAWADEAREMLARLE